jgi:hypothetical protein
MVFGSTRKRTKAFNFNLNANAKEDQSPLSCGRGEGGEAGLRPKRRR